MYAWRASAALMAVAVIASGCSISSGPTRLYPVEEEVQAIRNNLKDFNITLADFSRLDETSRIKYRNDWIAARMYAIDLEYTGYEAALTKERQNIGFAAAATTIGLTTGSGLATSTLSKDVLTGVAGAITGARAAYENDILFAHSVQWIQTQMRTQRTYVAERILRGMKASTIDYPLAAALSDLEDYYRAGTFTGGVIGTTATLGAEANLAELAKQDRVEVTFVPNAAARALRACLVRPHPGVSRAEQQARLVKLLSPPSHFAFAILLQGKSPQAAEKLLSDATRAGFCP